MHSSVLTLIICFVAYVLSEQCRVSRYHQPLVRAFSRKKRIITVFPNFADMKITAALPKALMIRGPTGYNLLYELSFYYPLQTKLEEWYPKKLKNRLNKLKMDQGHKMKMPMDHHEMMPPAKDHGIMMPHEIMDHNIEKPIHHDMVIPHSMEHHMMPHEMEHHVMPWPMKSTEMTHDLNIPVEYSMMSHEMTMNKPKHMKMSHEMKMHSMMSHGMKIPMQPMPMAHDMNIPVEHTMMNHEMPMMMTNPQAMEMPHEPEIAMKPMILSHDMQSPMKSNIMPYDMEIPMDGTMMSHEMKTPMTSPEIKIPMTHSGNLKTEFNDVYYEGGPAELFNLRRLDYENGTKLAFAKPQELQKYPWSKKSYQKFRKKLPATINPSYYDSLKWGRKQIKSWSHPLRQHQSTPPRMNFLGHILHRRGLMPIPDLPNLFDEREVDLYESNQVFRKNYRAHREHRNIYNYIEKLGFNFGYDLKSCLLRAICESRRYLLPMGYDLIQDLIRIGLSPPSDRIMIDEYSKAHYEDNCGTFDKDCPFSILDMALNPG